eukprot:TRINITY_DN10161_c0_g1_i2.p1 TRINITY_DN10161_c0_g1~~TRINITY_DN10161_c0_g1_i2.p1  ORF type:complete len:317 (+),score=82.48 TRINITY_DN10161_c0_g1_i2:3-953(+)
MSALLYFALLALALTPASAGSCNLLVKGEDGRDEEYDIRILSKHSGNFEDNWAAPMSPRLGIDLTAYEFYINPCEELVGLSTSEYGENVTAGASMLQVERTSDKSDRDRNLKSGGTYVSAELQSFHKEDLRYVMRDGDRSATCLNQNKNDPDKCPGRTTTILMFCADVGYGSPVFIEELSHLNYFFAWHTCAACEMSDNIRVNCGPKPVNSCGLFNTGGMSTGEALLIVFFVLASFYLIVGVLYNRFVAGKTGLEQIPNYHMWCSCLSYAKEGFKYVFSCGRSSATMPTYHIQAGGLEIDDDDSDLDDDAEDQLYS